MIGVWELLVEGRRRLGNAVDLEGRGDSSEEVVPELPAHGGGGWVWGQERAARSSGPLVERRGTHRGKAACPLCGRTQHLQVPA